MRFKGFGPGGGESPKPQKAKKTTKKGKSKNGQKRPKAKGQEIQKKNQAGQNTCVSKGLAEISAKARNPKKQQKARKKQPRATKSQRTRNSKKNPGRSKTPAFQRVWPKFRRGPKTPLPSFLLEKRWVWERCDYGPCPPPSRREVRGCP